MVHKQTKVEILHLIKAKNWSRDYSSGFLVQKTEFWGHQKWFVYIWKMRKVMPGRREIWLVEQLQANRKGYVYSNLALSEPNSQLRKK